MPRYFVELAYDGSQYSGWQRQNNALSVQQVLEEKFSQVLQSDIQIVGCGRTDAGVHARQYFLHFDSPEILTEQQDYGLRSIQPKDIAIYTIFKVKQKAHARFDAELREYVYHISLTANPFNRHFTWAPPKAKALDWDKLNAAASMIGSYSDFFPFCKAGSDVENYGCQIKEVTWDRVEDELQFTISANRFLRGMVRMIVGACINISEGKLSIQELKEAMEKQERLHTAYSVPGHGLFLNRIMYPDSILL